MTMSWDLPVFIPHNGVITGYFLSCVPEAGGGNSISKQYTAAGTFTLGGFTPATSYNCSISSNNSQGRGPTMYVVVTTLDDGKCGKEEQNVSMSVVHSVTYIILLFPAMLFQLQLSSFPACHEWVVSTKLFTASTALIVHHI